MSTTLATIISEGSSALGINLLNPTSGQYAIVTTDTAQPVVTPDTVAGFEYKGEQRISTYPLEQGAFSSFNKVAVPFDIRMDLSVGGQNFFQSAAEALDNYLNSLLGTAFGQPMTREDFLDALQTMLESTDSFDIVTPEKTYENCNLVHYDYSKKANKGAVMINASLWFEEVRETASALYSSSGAPNVDSNSPSASASLNAGSVTGSVPNAIQQSIFNSGSFV